jgi:diguanylate cyclase (GGDEF)-like protein
LVTVPGYFLVGAVIALALVAIGQSYLRANDFLAARLAASLAVGENSITRTLDSVAFALGAIVADADPSSEDGGKQARKLIADILRGSPAIRQILVLDMNGRLLSDSADSAGATSTGVDLATLGLPSKTGDDENLLALGQAIPGRYLTIKEDQPSGQWTIPALLVVRRPGETPFQVVAALNPIYFTSILDVVRTEDRAQIVMTRFDGASLAAVPPQKIVRLDLLPRILRRLPETDHGRLNGYYPFARGPGFLVFKSSPRYPVAVIAGMSRGDVIQEWLQDDWQMIIAMVGLPFLVAAVTWAQGRLIDSRLTQAELRRLAQHDTLTGLPNRSLLDDRLTRAIGRAERNQTLIAVVFIDLNDFKPINDTYGHRVGDETLIAVAERLRESLRQTDTVGRIGGDEFVAVLEQITDEHEIHDLAAKIMVAVSRPILHGDTPIVVSASLGISIYPKDGSTPPVLLEKADKAMYRAKRMRGVCIYSDSLVAS